MECRHERLKTVGDILYCADCKEELPMEFLVNRTKQAEKPAAEAKPDKSTPRKRTAKKAV